jgi:dolichol-phosphate mannosyltransferase
MPETHHILQSKPAPAKLSFVIPMYNEEAVVDYLRVEMERFMGEVSAETELILVNAGSSDGTLDKIVGWAAEDNRIKVIHLSRNFGHQLASTAGLDHASGDAVVLIDADLQDPLHVVHLMLERYQEGYDVVYGQRQERRGESPFKRLSAWTFYRMMRVVVYKRLPLDTGDFRLISRECLDGLKRPASPERPSILCEKCSRLRGLRQSRFRPYPSNSVSSSASSRGFSASRKGFGPSWRPCSAGTPCPAGHRSWL